MTREEADYYTEGRRIVITAFALPGLPLVGRRYRTASVGIRWAQLR